ncbi:EAL domain-containing protein [Gracilibacillus caseinilyticus]|uniref:EAL domain-containing protein n=1 Tax=Gracilibacillus caseinilyticus TaxID=2932256 RepID=A0ABY4EWJ1_9BACI|nr:EAL domain-containing protein [Gracilibacillus caseinilyticus]UOQ48222.1 EAL domain-containing protein [Gracilibacillus caseinilyticus]
MNNINLGPYLSKKSLYHMVQPIVELTTNKVYGYEMLLRSKDMDSPEKIFGYAEKKGKLFDLDMYSINKAFEEINERASELKGKHLFINILPSNIANNFNIQGIEQLKSTLKPTVHNIVFEITEERKEAELLMCKTMVSDMKKQGFLIALDDLGKGDSTIPYAMELEPNIVKLDCYFSQNLAYNLDKQRAIQSIIKLLGDDPIVILEGLEKVEDLYMAKALGIRYAQGYVLGKPGSIDYYLSSEVVETAYIHNTGEQRIGWL